MYSSLGNSNCYNQNKQQQLRMSQSNRARRARDKSRDGFGEEQRVTPCTEFDKAYFHNYAHVGIHEEMIKTLICFYDPIDGEQDQLIEGSPILTQGKENH